MSKKSDRIPGLVGADRPRCTGKYGKPCGNYPIAGGPVCWLHGGVMPVVKQAAAERIANAEAEKVLIGALKDVPPMQSIGDVYADLLAVAGINRVWRQILQQRVSELTTLGVDTIVGPQAHVDVALFERALSRCAKLGTELARLNLEERRQALNEQMASTVADVIWAVLEDVNMTESQREQAMVAVPKRLREVEQ